MRRLLPFFTLLALTSTHAAPTAQEILATVRMQQARQDIAVEGQLREGEKVVPFRLTQTGAVIRYTFSDPDEALQLRLDESDSRLEEITREGVEKISGPQFDQKVRGTAITYADLALRFLYWRNARVLGEETINTAALLETAARRTVQNRAVCDRVALGGSARRRAHAP